LLVILTDLEQERIVATEDLTMLFDLSNAESEIAALLANGLGLAQIAETRGVATATVRAQLKVLFRKMDANRQSDLVRVMERMGRPAVRSRSAKRTRPGRAKKTRKSK